MTYFRNKAPTQAKFSYLQSCTNKCKTIRSSINSISPIQTPFSIDEHNSLRISNVDTFSDKQINIHILKYNIPYSRNVQKLLFYITCKCNIVQDKTVDSCIL